MQYGGAEEERRQTNEMQNGGEGEEERRGNANEMQRGWHPTGKVLGNVIGGVVGKLRGGENLMQNGKREGGEEERRWDHNMMQNANGQEKRQNMMQNANGQEKRQGCNLRSDGELRCPKWEEKREQTNEMQNGGEGEEERRGNANEMQRGWHPTGKVLSNVVGGIVGKLRGGENLMQNANGQEKRQGCNLRSDGELRCPKWEEKREQTNEMQNGGEGEEERRKMCMYGPDGTPDETLCQ